MFTFVILMGVIFVYICNKVFVYICKMKKIDIENLCVWHDLHHEKKLEERYLTLKKLKPFIAGLDEPFSVQKIGESFEGRDICELVFGKGSTSILLWTQMHGNESTGTKAFLDLIHFILTPGDHKWLVDLILKECTVYCIPMLNPDGAEAYTRVNAQGIDLNRDVIDTKALESQLLQKVLKKVNPQYCFNLHDQRTIFSVAPDNKTATVSFLAPSIDQERTITAGRKETMRVIASINEVLQQVIPGRIGRYTDEFYPTATGDNFQKMGHNTILIESGHSKGDYKRAESRQATFIALLEGLRYVADKQDNIDYKSYFDIPNNEKKYLDIIVKNCKVAGENKDVGILYIEKLKNGVIVFEPGIDQITDLSDFNADKILTGEGLVFSNENDVENWVKNRFN